MCWLRRKPAMMNPHAQLDQSRIHPPMCWPRLKRKPPMMNPVHMKSQKQSKRYTSVVLIIMPHNQSILISTCHILRVWKWTGWLTMCYTIDSSSGNLNARIFWNVNLLPSLNARSVRRLSHGLVTLEWISMYHVGYPKMTWSLTQYGRGLKISVNCNPMRCMPNLIFLTSFHQGNKSVDEWYNAVQAHANLAKYPPETMKILHHNIFWFFLHDEDFVSRTITEGSVDLDKFPTSRVCQLAKKFESSKATVCHIKQVAGDPQVTQINLLRHQQTELPTNRHNKKRRQTGRPKPHKAPKTQHQIRSRNLMKTESHIGHLTTVINVVTPYMHKDSNALWRSTNAKFATNMVTFPVYGTKRRPRYITRTVTEILKCTNFMWVPCMHRTVPITVIPKSPVLMNNFACSYKPKAIMLKVSRFQILSIL